LGQEVEQGDTYEMNVSACGGREVLFGTKAMEKECSTSRRARASVGPFMLRRRSNFKRGKVATGIPPLA